MIDAVCEDVKQFMETENLKDLIFGVVLGIWEVLSNAVRYGSNMDSSKEIVFFMKIYDSQILARVIDSGPGFNWRVMEKKRSRQPKGMGGESL